MAIARLSAPIHPSFASAAKAFLKSSSTSSILDLQQSFADLIHHGTKGDRQDKFDRIEMTLWLEESASDDSEKALTVRGLCHLAGYRTDKDAFKGEEFFLQVMSEPYSSAIKSCLTLLRWHEKQSSANADSKVAADDGLFRSVSNFFPTLSLKSVMITAAALSGNAHKAVVEDNIPKPTSHSNKMD